MIIKHSSYLKYKKIEVVFFTRLHIFLNRGIFEPFTYERGVFGLFFSSDHQTAHVATLQKNIPFLSVFCLFVVFKIFYYYSFEGVGG